MIVYVILALICFAMCAAYLVGPLIGGLEYRAIPGIVFLLLAMGFSYLIGRSSLPLAGGAEPCAQVEEFTGGAR